MELACVNRAEGDMPESYRPHFQGDARFQHFRSPFGDGPAVFMVHFAAGGRTRPHRHHSGQVLHVTEGEGIVADDSGPHRVRAGDVVTVLPDEWHWHEGTPTTAMSHFTVQQPGPEDIVWDVEEGSWAEGYER